ncbi:flavin reductase family protein [Sphingobium chungbukense]|uniref:Flavin reductase like domain-containing protein n=1 Tax=Sphingobium chungbukense TaxID=56193 RepID=A0A0M3AQ26_9SPHN|nr:flavin reductase family protein [Sphingobium chungbukense]KKW92028.1 hypothetical protein YP76_13240 [Sphingobium chungbukense]
MSQSQLEPDVGMSLKVAMRRMASAVSIVTAVDAAGERAAMTATSVTSLTLDPPSMLVCINRNARIHRFLEAAGNFCINILAADQIVHAQACGGGSVPGERFAIPGWDEKAGIPVLDGAQAAILCRQKSRMTFGTHDIVIGEVMKVLIGNTDVDPLLYIDGSYARVGEKI